MNVIPVTVKYYEDLSSGISNKYFTRINVSQVKLLVAAIPSPGCLSQVSQPERGANRGRDGKPDICGSEEPEHSLDWLGRNTGLPWCLVAESDGGGGEEALDSPDDSALWPKREVTPGNGWTEKNGLIMILIYTCIFLSIILFFFVFSSHLKLSV